MNTEKLILVDSEDNVIGSAGKMEVHEKGLLHRAFSVFIYNSKGEMLLQKRSLHKYHSAGLWSNACCSHPSPGESIPRAIRRRLREELGIETETRPAFQFTYRTEFRNGLTEHEFDHVYTGVYDGPIPFNNEEVMAVEFRSVADLKSSLEKNPDEFTSWFHIAFPLILDWHKGHEEPALPGK